MEQLGVSWTRRLCLAVLMYLQVTCTFCSRNTTHCSSIPCKEGLPCSSFTGCGSISDPCLSNPCPQNATCQVTLDTETYECRCPAGFKGRNCEIPMKRCLRNLCRHGGQCYITDRGSTCLCAVGYKGTFCETPEDDCLWNPCQNGAVCRDRGNGQACYCVPGFQGALCDIEVNECISQPCQNGGTCLNQIGTYNCVCPMEYTGRNCEMEYNYCTSQPCLNGATCLDNLGSFSCECAAGFYGVLCDVNINECASAPCLNGGHCVDRVDGYICDCSMVGYTGLHCETPAPLCSSRPCQNNATCAEDPVSFQCLCRPGYTGSLCEIHIPLCESQPCMNGAECLEMTWLNMSETEGNIQDKSNGYICKCNKGFFGVHCEQDINECEANPCQNGGTCENLPGSYICHCPTSTLGGHFYGGPDCLWVLTGCKENLCQNGGSCIPYLMDNKHNYTCVCMPGFTGPYCEKRTTLSFNGRQVLPLTLQPQRGEPFNVSFTFRTVQTSATILYLGDGVTALRIYLQDGFLFLSLHCSSRLHTLLHVPHNLSDDHWHTVEVIVQDHIHLKLLDLSCGNVCVNRSHLRDAFNIEFQNGYVGSDISADGKHGSNITGALNPKVQFVGCIRDITVGTSVITEEDGKLANIEVGCKRHDYCESHPCGNRGKCINLWLSYYCECHRPYTGNNCSGEYEAVGFGYGNVTSYAVFQTRIQVNDDVIVSAFVRTKHDTGFLFAMGNSTHYDIIVSMESGKLTTRTGNGIMSKGDHNISDGQAHLVTLKLTQSKLFLFTSSLPLDLISLDIKREEYICLLYVGGLSDRLETIKRGGYFKGCIQDLRINGTALGFFNSLDSKNSTLVNLTKGCIDNDCKPILCQNGSSCVDTDSNDCSCSSNTAGETCKDLQWCQLTQCPSGSVCQPVPGGYECISNANFRGNGQTITFRSNGKIMRDLTNVTFGFRTMDSESVLLHAQREHEIIRIYIENKLLHFHIQSGNDLNAVRLMSKESVSDSRWHTVTLSMTAPGSQSSTWQMEIDGRPKTISSLVTGNLNFLREGTDIFLGVDIEELKRNFTGCLGTVLIEGIHLPYFGDTDYLMVKPQVEQFIRTSHEIVDIRCLVSDPCASNPCLFGGHCHDIFTHTVCTCPKGRSGEVCEIKTSECLPNPCTHGNCTIEAEGYKCECETGYTGPNCDFIDCHGHLCARGATCVLGADGHFCHCPSNVTGELCRFNIMPSIFCGDEKKNITCYNYSNCTQKNGVLGCACQPGYVGERCEIDIDECASNPCLNGGICQNLPNRFHCICDMNFAGDMCEIDLSDFLPPGVFTVVASSVLALFFAVCAGLCIFIAIAGMRSSQGTYSPSRQEKEGSRVEMWNIAQPPPLERLI